MRIALLLTMLLALAPAAHAQLVNGDFENGATGWSSSGSYPASFPAAGGNPNGYGRIVQNPAGNSGNGMIFQTFDCGPAPGDSCEVNFTYRMSALSGPGVADFWVSINSGPPLFSTFTVDGQWHAGTVSYPCGTHTLQFQLLIASEVFQEVDLCLDNVTATCVNPTPVTPLTWGQLKTLPLP